jgi:thioredoxin
MALLACNPGNTNNQVSAGDLDTTGKNQKVIEQNTNTTTSQVATEGKPISISEDEFTKKVFDFRKGGKWQYKGDKPAIIDFYADWCGPCRSIAPYLKELAETYKGQIYVYKVNTDYAQDLSMFFSINAIPAVMFCPMKGDYKMEVGAMSKEHYEDLVKTVLLK